MAIVGERHGIFPKLKAFVQEGKPVWGTCAGMILLSNKAVMQKEGGQPLIGGLDVEVCRNYFGSQVISARERRRVMVVLVVSICVCVYVLTNLTIFYCYRPFYVC